MAQAPGWASFQPQQLDCYCPWLAQRSGFCVASAWRPQPHLGEPAHRPADRRTGSMLGTGISSALRRHPMEILEFCSRELAVTLLLATRLPKPEHSHNAATNAAMTTISHVLLDIEATPAR